MIATIILPEYKPNKALLSKLKKYLKKVKNISLVEIEGKEGLAKTYNTGIRMAKTEIFITIHQDCLPLEKNAIGKLLEPFKDEKIVQPMVARSIPIYYGNPSIAEEFNEKSFINVHKFDNFEEAIKKIIEIDNNEELYFKMLNEPWLKKNNIGKYVNEQRILKRLVKIIRSKK